MRNGRAVAIGRAGIALMALALGGCDALPGVGAGGADGGDAPAAAAASPGTRDVEAPDAFRAAEPGLWDGRPSLGGIWVAHPDVRDPERARIVNAENGREVVGALFRRERDLPGPALQVSSDAAEALGLLAGAPTDLVVTALRREEAPAAEPEEAVAEAAAESPEAPAQAPAGSANAIATTTLDAAPAPQPAPQAAPEPAPQAAADPAAAPAPTATAAALNYPYVQLGTYGTEEAARSAGTPLAAQGLPARVAPDADGAQWRLLLGPATTEAEQTALRARAVAAGFADAYLVRS